MVPTSFFAALLAEDYGIAPADLQSLGEPGAIRLGYRVEGPDGTLAVLRACRREWVEQFAPGAIFPGWLADRAALLAFLTEQGYPSPRLIATRDGAPIAVREGWAVLLTEFIPGEETDYAPATLRGLAAALGRLHTIDVPHTRALPNSWWHPAAALPIALARLAASDGQVPPSFQLAYETFQATLLELRAHGDLPQSLIHADAWAGNALRDPVGRIVLIDWDWAGWGPTVLDFASLLLHVHYDRPGHEADAARIATVVRAYSRHRALNARELAALLPAIRFGPAYRAALHFAIAREEGWTPTIARRIHREYERHQASAGIARYARDSLRQGS